MTDSLLRSLGVREQDLSSLSMCKSDKASVEQWLGTLPTAHIGETTKQLYNIIQELLRLDTPADNRLEILDILAPWIQNNIRSLASHYQHKPVLLPKKAQQIVDLTHALRMCLANNYTLAAVQLANSKSGLLRRPNKAQTGRAIALGLQVLHNDLLMCYQLYAPCERAMWLKAHQLYLIADELEIAEKPQPALGEEACSIHDLYIQTLLLGSIKANQMRQDDLLQVVKLIPRWVDRASVEKYMAGEIPSLFVIDQNKDRSPVYAHLLSKKALSECTMQFSTSNLVQHLRQLVDQAEDNVVDLEGKKVRADLLNHLILAWGKCTKRSFMRIESNEELDICIGLSAAHAHSRNGQDLQSMINKAGASARRNDSAQPIDESIPAANDPWSDRPGVLDSDDMEEIDMGASALPGATVEEHSEELPKTIRVKVNNASPGGYSMSLPENGQTRLSAGDLIAVKDASSEMWSVAAVRWLHRPAKAELTFGVELLSPAFVPSVSRTLATSLPPSDFAPVLMLPAVSVTGQDASLLAADTELKAGQVMQLLERDEIRMVRVGEQLAKTRVYAQYSYTDLEASNDEYHESNQEFDQLWGNL